MKLFEKPRRNSRLQAVQASRNKQPTPPSSPGSPQPPSPLRLSLPLPPLFLIPLHDNGESNLSEALQDHNPEFIDSQDLEQGGRQSSCGDISSESGDEGDYEHGEARSLEELWWPKKLLWSADNHRRERKKSRKDEDKTTPTRGATDTGKGVPLEVNDQPNAHAGIGPATPPFPAKLVTLLKQLVGSQTELVGWPDQLPGLVASLASRPTQPLPPPAAAKGEGQQRESTL